MPGLARTHGGRASAVSQWGQSINTNWLHDWIPWAPKLHQSITPPPSRQLCLSNRQLRQPRMTKGGSVQTCVLVYVGGRVDTGGYREGGSSSSTDKNTKVMSTIVTWYCLLILDHKRTQCLSLVITSTPCTVLSFSYLEIYLRAKLLSHTLIVCFLSCPVFSCSYSSSTSSLSYSSSPILSHAVIEPVYIIVSSFHK